MSRVVHLCVPEKFIPPFIQLVEREVGLKEQLFLMTGKPNRHSLKIPGHTRNLESLTDRIASLKELYSAKKIILHGLNDSKFLYLLALNPRLLKKCYWSIWGNDLYQYLESRKGLKNKFKEIIRRFVIRRIGYILTCVPGDYRRAQDWYGARAKLIDCIMYESNVIYPESPSVREEGAVKILLGNSAFQRNNHFDALDRLSQYAHTNIQVYVPLSYGPQEYARQVAEYGEKIFGKKIIPMFDFMEKDDYLRFLSAIDIAIFNNFNQQAMGNMVALIGKGKTVYLRDTVSSWEVFAELGLVVRRIEDFGLSLISEADRNENMRRTANAFSLQKLATQLRGILS